MGKDRGWRRVGRWERRGMPWLGFLAALLIVGEIGEPSPRAPIVAILALCAILWAVSIIVRDRVNSNRRETARD